MTKATIELDSSAGISVEGVYYSTFLGDQCDPAVEGGMSWTDLISDVMEMYSVPSGPLVYDIDSDSVQEVMAIIDEMRNAADALEERVRMSKILLRDKWVEAGAPRDNQDFLVNYGEYLDYVVNENQG